MDAKETPATKQGFQIFRFNEAPDLMTAGCMTIPPFAPAVAEGMKKLGMAGLGDGEEVTVLANIPGFSLTHVWFKAGFPLPLHSHDADCLYYIIAGSLQLGTETLGPRDSFFVPCDAAYAYVPGPEGVELLEFRTANAFDFKVHAKNPAFYDKAAATIAEKRESWKAAPRPALNT